jgi:hypothetical protein
VGTGNLARPDRWLSGWLWASFFRNLRLVHERNTTSTGLKTGQGNFHAAFPSAVAIAFFVAGSFLGNLLSQFVIPTESYLVSSQAKF